jgi:hypothetical protein
MPGSLGSQACAAENVNVVGDNVVDIGGTVASHDIFKAPRATDETGQLLAHHSVGESPAFAFKSRHKCVIYCTSLHTNTIIT